MNMDKNGPNI